MKKGESHILYYSFLALILAFVFLLAFLSPSKQLQMTVIVMGAIFYVGLGVVHHLINHDLTVKIMIEYILMGSLGLTIMFFLLKGGLGA